MTAPPASPQTEGTCPCGAVRIALAAEPLAQVYCHCKGCQRAHSAAYVPRAIYPAGAVAVAAGTVTRWVNVTRTMVICAKCGSHLWGEAEGVPFKGVNAALLPAGAFQPDMHIWCKDAVMPVVDGLPHYADVPAEWDGSGERMHWPT